MEFPDLGGHCALEECRMLDFLPLRCSGCNKYFCKNHAFADYHSCASLHMGRKPTSICPLCSREIVLNPEESIDSAVNDHIEKNCRTQADEKVYKNRCCLKTCKKKEMIPFDCNLCSLNFCVKHRHPQDHRCGDPTDKRPITSTPSRPEVVSEKSCGLLPSVPYATASISLRSACNTPSTTAQPSMGSAAGGILNHTAKTDPSYSYEELQGPIDLDPDVAMALAIEESLMLEERRHQEAQIQESQQLCAML